MRLAIDQVPHDCHIVRNSGDQTAIISACFGWCGTITGKHAEFDDSTATYIYDQLTKVPCNTDVASALTGNFVTVVFDAANDKAFVLADRWAVRCFYYASTSDRVVIASHASVVAAILEANIDGRVWMCNVRNTVPPPHATLFQGVFRGLPGQMLLADSKSAEIRITAASCTAPDICCDGFSVNADRLEDAVRSSVFRCAKLQPVCVDLTGGNDTRLTAAALSREGMSREVTFRVTDEPGTADAILAHRIASRLGSRVISRPRGAGEYSEEVFRDCAIRLDGHLPSLDDTYKMTADRNVYGAFHFHLGSLGGELSRDFFWRHEYLRWWSPHVDLQFLLRRRLYAAWPDNIMQAIDLPLSREDHNSFLIEPFEAICRHLRGTSKFYILDVLYLWRLGRKMATLWSLATSKTSLLPFLSQGFLDVALRIPWTQRAWRRLTLEVLWRMAPDLCDIPHDNGSPMFPYSGASGLAHLRATTKEVKNKVILRRKRHEFVQIISPLVSSRLRRRLDELVEAGCYTGPALALARLFQNSRNDTIDASQLAPLVGFGELLLAYPEISREFSFAQSSFDTFQAISWIVENGTGSQPAFVVLDHA